jgi:phosphodiesterase/alkaline phosphatase D-like protein
MRPLIALAVSCALASCSVAQPDVTDRTLLSPVPDGTRTWIGPHFQANRLQDWRIAGGRIECLEGRAERPMRTVHSLTRTLGEPRAAFELSVRTAPLDGGPTGAGSWTGFLVGAGGEGIDYRLTALCHHRPARDGGLVCAVDGTGRAHFRDNEHNEEPGSWGITGPLAAGELREIEAAQREGAGRDGAPLGEVVLQLRGEPSGERYVLRLRALDGTSGAVLSAATLTDVDADLVAGNVALVSHGAPAGSTRGHWFRDWTVDGGKVETHGERAQGPILATQYTVSRGVLKLTAQMAPVGERDPQEAFLALRREAPDPRQVSWQRDWRVVANATLDRDSCTFHFRVPDWDASRSVGFAVFYEPQRWEGTIRAEPADGALVLAAFTGTKHFTGGLQWNHDGIWFPHRDLVAHVRAHDPDLLFFSGDQIYEGDITGAQRAPPDGARLDYLDKWYRWCLAFGDLARDRPCICIPDDHDVYHGNIWGAGGVHAKRQDDGGYTMPAKFVNMVQRTQTSHLPDPFDPTPVAQGIGVYYTRLEWGGVSFAILEDRKWKSSPTIAVPEARIVNGWFQNADFDPRDADVSGAELLGARQLAFLRAWATEWSAGAWAKCALSQTIFANVATLPRAARNDGGVPDLQVFAPGEYAPDDKLAADADSNGWPQSGRNAALRELRRGFALHVAGDQHLGSLIRYGVDEWNDAGYAFCVPSIGNTFPRRWFPPHPGEGRAPDEPRYTGRFRDGFGNRITVLAVSNPHPSGREPARLHDRAPGYGIVRFARESRTATIECWPRWSDPRAAAPVQYPGWPRTVALLDNYARTPAAHLPTIVVEGMLDPVVRVVDEENGEIVYALRIAGREFRPPVFRIGPHTIEVGDPDRDRWQRLTRVVPTDDEPARLSVRL